MYLVYHSADSITVGHTVHMVSLAGPEGGGEGRGGGGGKLSRRLGSRAGTSIYDTSELGLLPGEMTGRSCA